MASKRQTTASQGNLLRDSAHDEAAPSYAGDRPNPELRAFVEAYLSANVDHDAEKDEYRVTPNVGSVTTSKRTPIYGLHTYDSKKPPDALKRYIEHFTRPGDLVLDSFVGSGMTAIAALS